MLSPGTLQQVKDSGIVERAIALRVTSIEEANGKLKCQFSDGKENMSGVITSQVSCCCCFWEGEGGERGGQTKLVYFDFEFFS